MDKIAQIDKKPAIDILAQIDNIARIDKNAKKIVYSYLFTIGGLAHKRLAQKQPKLRNVWRTNDSLRNVLRTNV